MDGSACPICDSISGQREFGGLVVSVCSRCGHGHLIGQQEANEVFESNHYAAWRLRNIGHLRREAKKKVDLIRGLTNSVPGDVLEFGCATGEVLAEFSRVGSQCYGLDLSETTTAIASRSYPNVSFHVGVKPDSDLSFDLIVASHVLEHIEDTNGFFDTVNSCLREDGYLYLSIPNFDSMSRKTLSRYWPDFMPEHRHYFTSESVRLLLEKNGLEIVSTRTKGESWQWLGGLKRLVQKTGNAKKESHSPGTTTMLALRASNALFAPLLVMEGWCGIGSELIVIGRKTASPHFRKA